MSTKTKIWMLVTTITAVTLLLLFGLTFQIVTVHGNEVGVKETWSHGVEAEPYGPKTYFLVPGWSQKMFTYDTSSKVLTMNDTPSHIDKKYKGR